MDVTSSNFLQSSKYRVFRSFHTHQCNEANDPIILWEHCLIDTEKLEDLRSKSFQQLRSATKNDQLFPHASCTCNINPLPRSYYRKEKNQSITKILFMLSIVRTFLNAIVHTKNVTCDHSAQCLSKEKGVRECMQSPMHDKNLLFVKNLLHLVLFTTSKPSRVLKGGRKRKTTQTSNLVLIE